MTGIPFGTIALTDFPFTDLSAAKRRPALVVSTDNDRRTDVVVPTSPRFPSRNYLMQHQSRQRQGTD